MRILLAEDEAELATWLTQALADSLRFLQVKMDEITAAGVDVIASGNTGCLLQFRQGVLQAGLGDVRVLHTVELVRECLAP